MDLEAAADGWTVFFGVALVSVAMTGAAVSLPTAPPPDTSGVANAIDRAAGTTYGASITYEYDAEEVWVGPKRFGLKNEAGAKSSGSISFGTMTPVLAGGEYYEDLETVLYGKAWQEVFASKWAFIQRAADARENAANNVREWRPASETLRIRTVVMGDEYVTIVAF